jgi:Glyoxalase-like domain
MHSQTKQMSSDLHSFIDHLVIRSYSLDEGVEYVHQILNVLPVPGGIHTRMGTHNCLFKLGSSIYLEVIAINPQAPPPGRPRWFEMDKLAPGAEPKLLTWVLRTNDIQQALNCSAIDFGKIESMSRGNLNWLISVPEDGSMPMEGIAPTLIRWQAEPHPATQLPDSGCSLLRLEGYHPKANEINKALLSIGFKGAFTVQAIGQEVKPSLIAYIETPAGTRKLIT